MTKRQTGSAIVRGVVAAVAVAAVWLVVFVFTQLAACSNGFVDGGSANPPAAGFTRGFCWTHGPTVLESALALLAEGIIPAAALAYAARSASRRRYGPVLFALVVAPFSVLIAWEFARTR